MRIVVETHPALKPLAVMANGGAVRASVTRTTLSTTVFRTEEAFMRHRRG
jgi:hypothetical protein